MLPDKSDDVRIHLAIVHQKLRDVIVDSESKDVCLQILYKIASIQTDLKAIALNMLMCQLNTSLQLIGIPNTPNLDEELKRIIEGYKVWLDIRK